MAKLAIDRPFDEAGLHDNLVTHPVRTYVRQPDGFGERSLRNLKIEILLSFLSEAYCTSVGTRLQ